MLDPGHVEFLRKAKAFGDFLIVGIHTDKDINDRKGECYPIMNIHERTLTVLSTKVLLPFSSLLLLSHINPFMYRFVPSSFSFLSFLSFLFLLSSLLLPLLLLLFYLQFVDEVIIGAPFHVSKYVLDLAKIQVVVHNLTEDLHLLPGEPDPYREVKELGIYHEVSLDYTLTTADILQRIIKNRLEYESRNTKKVEKDKKVNDGLKFIPEEIDHHNRPKY